MMQMAPPETPPCIALDDGDDLARLRLRLWQMWWTVLTIVATAWCFSLGWIPGIFAAVIAKHVLVALLVMDLRVDWPRDTNN
jgi:hypothetical protein